MMNRLKSVGQFVTFHNFLVVMLLGTYASGAYAEVAGAMPWDGPVCTVANAITGKLAFGISIAAFFGAGASLVWGEELSGIVKKLLTIVVAVSILVGGSSIYKLIAGGSPGC